MGRSHVVYTFGTYLDVVTKVTLVKVTIQIDTFPRFVNLLLNPSSVQC